MNVNRIAIIGECMVELKKVDSSLHQGFGGDTLNTAIYLSRLTKSAGIDVSYVTALGKDPFSKEMLNNWQSENINTDMVYISDTKLPGIYAIETTPDGERSFFYWRNDSAAKNWLKTLSISNLVDKLSQHQLIYLSGISIAILAPECRERLLETLAKCKEKGVSIAFDNNYRPTLWETAEDAQSWYTRILKLTDIAFLTYEDEQILWGDHSEEQSVSRSVSFGVKEIVLKRGGDACFIVAKDKTYTVAPSPIEGIIDTTAAGDSFSAGYLAKRILGGTEVESALVAHKVAGTVIQHRGAIIPENLTPQI